MGINRNAVTAMLDRARREVDDGMLPSVQVALGHEGEIVAEEVFGDATIDTRYPVFSCTKAFVAAAVWALIGDGLIDVSRRVAEIIPEFASNGKEGITIEQVMLHTAGFPHAPMRTLVGSTAPARRERFAMWRLNWEPGSSFEYHATSAHWVLADLIERVTGQDFRDVVEQRVTQPNGLPRVLGIASAQQQGIATLAIIGEPATAEELRALLGVDSLPVTEVTADALLAFNDPDQRAVGVPGGGGLMRARDLALFYQALLHNTAGAWSPAVLADATGHVRSRVPDRYTKVPANRSLGLVLAGDDGFSHIRGMGRTVSPRTFGHNGAGGQLAWADPVTGLSLGYCTNGLDQNVVREARRGTSISSLAGVCTGP